MKKLVLILLFLGISNTAIFSVSGGLPAQYGNGADGEISIDSGSVNIEDIYEDDSVSGVTTKRGTNKGLNYGAGTYDPENGAYIQAVGFTISSGATLTHGTAYGTGSSNKNGIIWVACINAFTNEGTINMDGKGASGGAGGFAGTISQEDGDNGYGSGLGTGGDGALSGGSGGAAGSSYGSSNIPITTWANLYGSGGGGGGFGDSYDIGGGGGGGGGHAANATAGAAADSTDNNTGNGGAGGAGGGAIRIYASSFDTSSGVIVCDGVNGGNGGGTAGGGGGGGSGGSIYIETLNGALGTDTMTASSGSGGADTLHGGGGGAGSVGRIHIVGSYTGSTSDPAIQ